MLHLQSIGTDVSIARSSSIYVDAIQKLFLLVNRIVHLVRHCAHQDLGLALSGRRDSGLTTEGKTDADRLALAFATGGSIGQIHSSPQSRAHETAQAIACRLDVTVRTEAALDEIDFGDWTGRSFTALSDDPLWRRWNEQRCSGQIPDGETMAGATARAVRHLDELAVNGDGEAVVCVTHCDIIRGAVAHYLGLSLDNLLRFDIDPGSITTLAISTAGGRLMQLNKDAP